MGANNPMGLVLGLIDDLSYKAYRSDREHAPSLTPNSWRKVYGNDVDAFERRYQDEINAYADSAIKREQAEPQHEFGSSACGRSHEPGK